MPAKELHRRYCTFRSYRYVISQSGTPLQAAAEYLRSRFSESERKIKMIISDVLKNNGGNSLLWYEKPAEDWNEALPVGNGKLGGMVFGGAAFELIQLNEDSLWSGRFRKRDNPNAYPNLEKVRKLIAEGHAPEAERLIEEAFYGRNEQQRHYLPLGDLTISMSIGEYSRYVRGLSLETGVEFTEFVSDNVRYSRQVFVSYPDDVLVVKLSADKPNSISLKASLGGRDDNYDKNEAYDDNTIVFTVSDGISYVCAASICSSDGKAYADHNILTAEGCSEVYIILGCESEFRSGNCFNTAINRVHTAARKRNSLYKRSTEDFSRLYNRCNISLSDNSGGKSSEPTDKRLENVRSGGKDNRLTELYYNFSKYLMISGSRQGSLPLNLQGIWNKDMWPAWGGKFTVNINTEMNYWAAEAQGLGDCCEPLFDHIERMREHGRVTAREMYHCGGAVCHHNTDIWGDCAPQDRWMPATIWCMGLAWLCLHIYEHYRFTMDKAFLAEKYDTLCEAAEFFTDFLIDDGNGQLVTSPSVSPENTYVTKSGEQGSICQGPSMDSQILYTLFTDIIEAADIIGADNGEFVGRLKELRERLPKPKIGKYGQIMEWAEDYDEVEPGHRHISQLFALYPGELITPENSPELARAAQATIERRLSYGGGHTGWSRAWIINMWARLHNGRQVGENITALLSYSTAISMLDMHPPFQIDGNFGGGAGIAEALMQSHSGEIKLLPAAPEEWDKGSVSGMRARGGFVVSFEWTDGRVTEGSIVSNAGEMCRIRGKYFVSADGQPVDMTYEDDVTSFSTETGRSYRIESLV